MPTLQRLSVFRDDVIFVIYIVQKWLYRGNSRELAEATINAKHADKEIVKNCD